MSFPHFSADCGEHHDLVRDFEGDRPPIVVLCGSTRFFDAFRRENLRLTLKGKIVLSIGCDTKTDDDLFGIEDIEGLKLRLDDLHKRKIDLADEVYVLNVGGYIGDSTRSEIEYAEKLGKPVRYLEPLGLESAQANQAKAQAVSMAEAWRDLAHQVIGSPAEAAQAEQGRGEAADHG